MKPLTQQFWYYHHFKNVDVFMNREKEQFISTMYLFYKAGFYTNEYSLVNRSRCVRDLSKTPHRL